MRSLAYGWGLKNWVQGSGVCIYTYSGGTPSVLELWVLSLSTDGASGVAGCSGARHGGGAHVPLCLQHVCGFFAVPCGHGRLPSVWFSRTIAGCLSIPAFTLLCLGKTTTCFFSSRTLVHGFFVSCCVSSIAAYEPPSLAILAIFQARHMSDCSSCTQPSCLAIVADMLKTYRKLVATSKVRFSY